MRISKALFVWATALALASAQEYPDDEDAAPSPAPEEPEEPEDETTASLPEDPETAPTELPAQKIEEPPPAAPVKPPAETFERRAPEPPRSPAQKIQEDVKADEAAKKERQLELDKELYHWAGNGDAAGVKRLLAKGANLHWRHPQDNWNALLTLCIHHRADYVEAAKVLLDAGADPGAQDGSKHTALWWAAHEGKAALVEALLDSKRGAPNYGFEAGDSFEEAIDQGHHDVVETLVKRNRPMSQKAKDKALGHKNEKIRRLASVGVEPEKPEQSQDDNADGVSTRTGGSAAASRRAARSSSWPVDRDL